METKEDFRDQLESIFDEIRSGFKSGEFDRRNKEDEAKWKDMVKRAEYLHKLYKPTHHKYVIENRGCDPSDPGFYDHIHTVEDLLLFTHDPHANDDPEDQTIEHDFKLVVYSRRWGHDDEYHLKRIKSGWYISHMAIKGDSDKSGDPALYANFTQDSINYPEALPGYMKWLWEQAEERGLSHEDVQSNLDILGNWIKEVEKGSPEGIWGNYK